MCWLFYRHASSKQMHCTVGGSRDRMLARRSGCTVIVESIKPAFRQEQRTVADKHYGVG